jgi:hypothetical protein
VTRSGPGAGRVTSVRYWYLLTKTRYEGGVVRDLESILEVYREQGIKVRVHRLKLGKCSREMYQGKLAKFRRDEALYILVLNR